MAGCNCGGGGGCNAETVDKKRVAKKRNTPRNSKNKKKVGPKTAPTVAEFVLKLEERWRIYHELELKQKDKDLRWFCEDEEDFRLVCRFAGLKTETVEYLFKKSPAAGNLEPIKRIFKL
jgi:hypothetical protein